MAERQSIQTLQCVLYSENRINCYTITQKDDKVLQDQQPHPGK